MDSDKKRRKSVEGRRRGGERERRWKKGRRREDEGFFNVKTNLTPGPLIPLYVYVSNEICVYRVGTGTGF